MKTWLCAVMGILGVALIVAAIIWSVVLIFPGPERWPVTLFTVGLVLTFIAAKWDEI